MLSELRPALVMIVVMSLITGVAYPLVVTGIAEVAFPEAGERQPDRARRQGGGLRAHRSAVFRPEILLEPRFRDRAIPL